MTDKPEAKKAEPPKVKPPVASRPAPEEEVDSPVTVDRPEVVEEVTSGALTKREGKTYNVFFKSRGVYSNRVPPVRVYDAINPMDARRAACVRRGIDRASKWQFEVELVK